MAKRRTKRLLTLAAIATALVAQSKQTYFPPVRGTREMVGAANNLEVEAGVRILYQGGNAVDAGVATVLSRPRSPSRTASDSAARSRS